MPEVVTTYRDIQKFTFDSSFNPILSPSYVSIVQTIQSHHISNRIFISNLVYMYFMKNDYEVYIKYIYIRVKKIPEVIIF